MNGNEGLAQLVSRLGGRENYIHIIRKLNNETQMMVDSILDLITDSNITSAEKRNLQDYLVHYLKNTS